MESSRASEVVP